MIREDGGMFETDEKVGFYRPAKISESLPTQNIVAEDWGTFNV
jgi:hypothetical protein